MGSSACAFALAVRVAAAPAEAAELSGPEVEVAPLSSAVTRDEITLSVRGDPQCIDARSMLDRIALELPDGTATAVEIELTIAEREVTFVITTSTGSATRRFAFEDADCEARSRVLALAIALALEALVVEEVEPPREPPKPTPAPAPAPPPPPPKVLNDIAPPPSRTPTWSLAMAPIAVFGAFPSAAFGGEVQPRISGRFWTARLGLAAFVSPAMPLGGGSFRAVAWTAAPEGCGRVPIRLASFRGCGGIEVGGVWSRGRGFARPRETTTPFVAPRLAIELAAPVSDRVALVLGTALGIPILRTRFVAGDLHASGWPVTLRATAGIALDLGRGGNR